MLAKKFGFGFGIAILLPMLIHYGVSTFSPNPKWQDYQVDDYYSRIQNADSQMRQQLEVEHRQLQEQYHSRKKAFERVLFFAATPIGIVTIIIGSFCAVEAIGAGLIFGGIITLVDGYCWYWSELADWMRFLSLLAAFVVLVSIGYTKLKDKGSSSLK